jgi:hypothetical protein
MGVSAGDFAPSDMLSSTAAAKAVARDVSSCKVVVVVATIVYIGAGGGMRVSAGFSVAPSGEGKAEVLVISTTIGSSFFLSGRTSGLLCSGTVVAPPSTAAGVLLQFPIRSIVYLTDQICTPAAAPEQQQKGTWE